MKTVWAIIIGVIFLQFLLRPALAETPDQETYMRGGVGLFRSAQDGPAEVKTVAVGYAEELAFGLRSQYELQGWLDSRGDLGRKCGGIASYSLGVDVNPGYFYFSAYAGVGLKIPNDAYLGGPFQFVETFSIGVRDNRQKSFGLFYSHISSAGIYSPNIGRDFGGVKVSVPF